MRPLLLALALFGAPGISFAQDVVNVVWRARFSTADGAVILSNPPGPYVELLRACGVAVNLGANPDVFPVTALRCPGALDFARSNELRDRVDQRLAMVLRQGHHAAFGVDVAGLRRRLPSIAFSLSPWGVFLSARDGVGTARYMGLNVQQAHLVILNKRFWDQLDGVEAGDPFLLHETLGALGIDDTDYAISNRLFAQSTTRHAEGDGDDDQPARVASREEGGASVVGRGGDPNQQMFKASLLRAADTQKIQLEGVDARLVPTPAELKNVINATPVTVAPKEFFAGKNLCADPDSGRDDPYTCGGFVLHGVGDKPFLLITQEWGGFPDNVKYKLLLKVFRNIVTELVKDKKK